MKLRAEISGQQLELDIRQDGTRIVASVEGRIHEVDARAPHPHIFLLMKDNRAYECRVDRTKGNLEAFDVTVNNRTYTVLLTDPKQLRGSEHLSSHSGGTAQIVAPMPGKVVRLLVEAGSEIEAGAGIVVVEAMKMQNELKSPTAGTVVEINVVAGATVNAGDVLAVVE